MAASYESQKRRRDLVQSIVKYTIDLIDEEDLKSGDFLPSTMELRRKFNTNTGVISDARKRLIELGFIEVVRNSHNVGTYVK